jgi:hypothetical protein
MVFWLIVFFMCGMIFGAGLMAIFNSGKTSDLYNEIDALVKHNEELATENEILCKKNKNNNNSYPTYSYKI